MLVYSTDWILDAIDAEILTGGAFHYVKPIVLAFDTTHLELGRCETGCVVFGPGTG
jgi:hypothetical protein